MIAFAPIPPEFPAVVILVAGIVLQLLGLAH
jgi:hypothetical protein